MTSASLCTSTNMAQLLEEADKAHIRQQVKTCKQILHRKEITEHEVGSGIAAVTLPEFGRKLNHVVGFGMAGSVSANDLAQVEKVYQENGIAGEVDLCPHADASVIDVLASNGYVANGWINSYVRTLSDADLLESTYPGVAVHQLTTREFEKFCRVSVAGYQDGGRPKLLLETLARSAILRTDSRVYFATVHGEVAGSAGLALIETPKGKVAHLHIDSTLPEYRGRGIQLALIQKRLSDARRAGYQLASVQARPTSGSARNIERAGFQLAYTKTTFLRQQKA